MKDQNPLIPSGSALEQMQRRKTKVLSTVFVIVAAHVLPITGLLLMQGCKPDSSDGQNVANNEAQDPTTPINETGKASDNELYTEFVQAQQGTNSDLSLPVQDLAGNYGSPLKADPANAIEPAQAPDLNTNPSSEWEIEKQVGGPANNQMALQGNTKAPNTKKEETEPVQKGLVEHTIRSGDYLSVLAKKYNTTLKDLLAANPGIDPRRLKVGYKLVVPQGTATAAKKQPATKSDTSSGNGSTYVVKAKDTLSGIARAHGVTLTELRQANGIRSHIIHPGQKLVIPVKNLASGR